MPCAQAWGNSVELFPQIESNVAKANGQEFAPLAAELAICSCIPPLLCVYSSVFSGKDCFTVSLKQTWLSSQR